MNNPEILATLSMQEPEKKLQKTNKQKQKQKPTTTTKTKVTNTDQKPDEFMCAFLSVSKARINKSYIFQQCKYIVYIREYILQQSLLSY